LHTNAKILDLSYNEITDIGHHWFYGFPNLLKIDLRFNYITNIWDEAFSFENPSTEYINSLLLIDLSNNYLNKYSRIYETTFQHLRRPSNLNLSNNQFTGLQEIPFASFWYNRIENQIFIYNNSIICDCDLYWIKASVTLKEKIHGMNCVNCGGKSIFDVKDVCKHQCGETLESETPKSEPILSPGAITAIVVGSILAMCITICIAMCIFYPKKTRKIFNNITSYVAGIMGSGNQVNMEGNINVTGVRNDAQ
jgi:hypothetical protein